ncbi:hypothetical protein [Nocardioides daejeonensis]|uniref:hypothetical protein n=1 Tax=Nocardioides daejeonensis TaxID=1046556 RepID=UPI0013A58517|nr:hypothetical protein [Nocardioides daejeonensis]
MRRLGTFLVSFSVLAAPILVSAGPAATAPPGAPAQERAKPALTLKVDKSDVNLGKKITFKGKVKPAKVAKGDTVALQKRIGTRAWKTEATTKVTKKGAFAFKDKPTTATARTYRAVIKKTKKHGTITSPKVAVAVNAWEDFTTFSKGRVASTDYRWRNTSAKVDNVAYPGSMLSSRFYSDYVTTVGEFNLYRQCRKLEGRVGLDDESATGATGQVRITLDGAVAYTRDLSALFTTAKVNLSLRNVQRMRVELSRTDTTVDARPALLSPRFLCTR